MILELTCVRAEKYNDDGRHRVTLVSDDPTGARFNFAVDHGKFKAGEIYKVEITAAESEKAEPANESEAAKVEVKKDAESEKDAGQEKDKEPEAAKPKGEGEK